MLDVKQFAMYVVFPTLVYLDPEIPYSLGAERLLIATAIQESGLRALQQYSGPAHGLFQIEPPTFDDLFEWVKQRHYLGPKVEKLIAEYPSPLDQLRTNLIFACAMARILYYRAPEPMPDGNDLDAIAEFYKLRYNTPLGAATVEGFKKKVRDAGWPFVQAI